MGRQGKQFSDGVLRISRNLVSSKRIFGSTRLAVKRIWADRQANSFSDKKKQTYIDSATHIYVCLQNLCMSTRKVDIRHISMYVYKIYVCLLAKQTYDTYLCMSTKSMYVYSQSRHTQIQRHMCHIYSTQMYCSIDICIKIGV